MAKKYAITGPLTKKECTKFIEDLGNSANVTILQTQLMIAGNEIYDLAVYYDEGSTAVNLMSDIQADTPVKKTVRKEVK